jgi:hypothetical protein
MGLTGTQRKYLRQEIERVLGSDLNKLRRILTENEEQFGMNLFNKINTNTSFENIAFNLIEELEKIKRIDNFIKVVREDEKCPNFAKSLSDNENNNSPNSSEEEMPSNQSGTQEIEGESQPKTNLDPLKNLLKQKKWIEADIETRKLLLDSIGHPKFVNEENFQNIKCDLLRGIDKLWREESKGRFGFSVQKKIWENINNRYSSFKKQRLIINRFGAEVGWYDNDIDKWLDVPKTNQDIECKTEGFWPTPPPSIISVDTIGKDLIPCLMKKLESCKFP